MDEFNSHNKLSIIGECSLLRATSFGVSSRNIYGQESSAT